MVGHFLDLQIQPPPSRLTSADGLRFVVGRAMHGAIKSRQATAVLFTGADVKAIHAALL